MKYRHKCNTSTFKDKRDLKRELFLLNWSNQVLDRKRRTGVQKQAKTKNSCFGFTLPVHIKKKGLFPHVSFDNWNMKCWLCLRFTRMSPLAKKSELFIQTGNKLNKNWWLSYALEGILLRWFVSACPLEGSYTANPYKFLLIIFILWWNVPILMGVLSSRITISPSTQHEDSLNGLMSMKMREIIYSPLQKY